MDTFTRTYNYATIQDAWEDFERMHGTEHPCQDRAALQSLIHDCGLRYEEIDGTFWAAVVVSPWVYGDGDGQDVVDAIIDTADMDDADIAWPREDAVTREE